jgi:hypothetical protein
VQAQVALAFAERLNEAACESENLSLPFYLDRRSPLLYGFLYHKLSTFGGKYFVNLADRSPK